ncbi:MAG TPA: SDR family NAD(P)-dependent oxidoreductase [Vicinamibacteria bacterium]|jgi:NAD(P)-dependent dehydrogenase (short-subunit alcohol dehydrogenase family)
MTGKHVLVSGAGTGIGRAIALRLAREGASVTLLARGRARLEETAASIEGAAHVEACDIRQRRRVDRAMERAAEELGPIHALVAASGVGGPNGEGDEGGDRFDDIVRTNLNGTYYSVRAMLRHLAPGPDTRHIVVISSILARIAVPGYTGYSASKAGLLGLVRSFAAELAPAGVQVNAICPGWVDTDMAWQGLDANAAASGGTREDAYRAAMREVPLRRMSQPDDIAGTVAWLLSPDARGVTGQAIDQNGGAWVG